MNMFVFSFTLKVILRSTTDDEQFSVECRKWFGIALSLVDSAVWLVQNIRPTLLTNQITYWILPRPRHLCFLVPQEVCLFLLCSYRVLVIFFFILIEHRVLEWFFCFRHSIEERLNISTSNSFTFRLQWKLSEKNQDFQNLSFHNELRLIACLDTSLFGRKKMVVPGYCDSNLHRMFPGSYFWVYSNWTVPVWYIRVRKFSKSFGTNSLFCVTSIRWNKRV